MDNKDLIGQNEADDNEELRSLISSAIQNKKERELAAKENEAHDISDQPAAVKKKKRRGWSAKKKTGVILGIIFLVFIIILAVIVGLFFHYTGLLKRPGETKINTSAAPINSSELVDEDDTFDEKEQEELLKEQLASISKRISDENVMNILLIGEDIRDTEGNERGNTDVMMIISINTEQKTITMTSLMRDMWVYLSDFNVNSRLNAAYWHGGSEYLEEVIEDYFGIEIDRYVKVNFYQFINVVEAVGGIDMEISAAEAEGMKDPMSEQNMYLGNSYGTDFIEWDTDEESQVVHLNGNQALAFARLRYVGNSDFERTERQRRVISEVIKNAKSLSFLKLDKLINEVFPEVETDITDGEIAGLLLNAFEYMSYDIQQLRLPADGYFTNEIINQMDVLVPNYPALAAILENLVYGDAATAEEAAEMYEEEQARYAYGY